MQNVRVTSEKQPKSSPPKSNCNGASFTQRIGRKRLPWRLPRRPKALKSAAKLTQPIKVENTGKSQSASSTTPKQAHMELLPPNFKKERTPPLQGNKAKLSTVSMRRIRSRPSTSIQALESTTTQAQPKRDVKKSQAASHPSDEVFKSHSQSSFDKASFNNALQKGKMPSFQDKKTKERFSPPDAPKEQAPCSTNTSAGKERAEQRWRYTSASYLGSTPKEVMQRVKELSQAGFSDELIDLILKRFPPTLKINSKNLYFNVNAFIKWKLQWKQILKYNPELFLLDTNHVSAYYNRVMSMVTLLCVTYHPITDYKLHKINHLGLSFIDNSIVPSKTFNLRNTDILGNQNWQKEYPYVLYSRLLLQGPNFWETTEIALSINSSQYKFLWL